MSNNANDITCGNHMIKWNYRITCEKTCEKIEGTDIAAITGNQIILSNIGYPMYSVDPVHLKCKPECMKGKIKAAYQNSKGYYLIVYEGCTIFFCGCEKRIGKLL
jgi:hypothetical protein